MRGKKIKIYHPHYSVTVSEKIQPFLEATIADQLAKLISEHSLEIAKALLEDFKITLAERVIEGSTKREFATTIRKKQSWEK